MTSFGWGNDDSDSTSGGWGNDDSDVTSGAWDDDDSDSTSGGWGNDASDVTSGAWGDDDSDSTSDRWDDDDSDSTSDRWDDDDSDVTSGAWGDGGSDLITAGTAALATTNTARARKQAAKARYMERVRAADALWQAMKRDTTAGSAERKAAKAARLAEYREAATERRAAKLGK